MAGLGAGVVVRWLMHPKAEQLLRFCLLPSLTLHPSRWERLLPQSDFHGRPSSASSHPVDAQAHQRWSLQLLHQLALQPLTTVEDPALPLAALEPVRFKALIAWCGAGAAESQLRTCIDREQLARVQGVVGGDALEFAFDHATALQRYGACALPQSSTLESAVPALGAAVLYQAFAAATAPVQERALLRLPVDAAQHVTYLCPALQVPATALAYARWVLQEMDAPWISSFAPTR
jgi:hypothetical protein